MMAAQVLDSKAVLRQRGTPATLPPEYAEGDYLELAGLSTPRTSTESLPAYDEAVSSQPSSAAATAGLRPTHTYQVESEGHPLLALPLAPRPSPIGVFAVQPDGSLGPLAYQSLRHARCSGDSVLVRADDPLALAPLCSTTYRFGPGRPPRIQLQGELAQRGGSEAFEVAGEGVCTRAHTVRTHLGTLRWRYAGRRETKAAGASSLLVLERVTGVGAAERRTRIAQLVRSEALRTPGTTRATAGNGGRLLMDLGEWVGGKAEARAAEVLVLSSCLVMLKKEVDRRRAAQCMVLAGASGGP